MIIFSVTMEMATFISKIWIKHNKKTKCWNMILKRSITTCQKANSQYLYKNS